MHLGWRWLATWLGAITALYSHGAMAQARTAEVVSSPPGLVTTPGVLVRVRGADIHPVGWASNDTLITPFYQNEDGDWFGWIGLLDLLKPDPDQILSVAPDPRNPTAQIDLRIFVHAPDEPLFPGPRPPAAPCQNEAAGLGPATDPATCAGGVSVRYVYRTKSGSWAPYSVGGDRPADLDRTTTSRGKDIPMIVRVETGIINRAPYAIVIPAEPGPDPSPGMPWPTTMWNGTLVYGAGDAFGLGVQGAARAGFFDVGRPATAKSCAETLIGLGYAIAASATVTGPAAYDIVAAETLLRVRERFIKRYALPRSTIGIGNGEGGAALMRIAASYPGLDSVGPATDAGLITAAQSCR